ncbi:hypothetical protein [Novosphingobium sp.]|uniref:hypothetical protein n=1 Tax=Novosphingobium sp. TaxID=1874826 RepID=UPI0035B3AD66
MKTIWLVKIATEIGVEAYYAGAASREDALLMAAERDLTGDAVTATEIPNKFGIQPGEWRSAV